MSDSDIIVSEKKKINIFDRVIQTVVIMVNMSKMNRAIDEHLNNINKLEKEEQKEYQENILREIVFVKYQYDIMQREMYELKMSYSDDVITKISSTDKTDRLELQKLFLEMEYDRVTKAKFKLKEDIKYHLLTLSSVIEQVKQNIKDEGKNQRYNNLVRLASNIDTKIQTEEYSKELYTEMFTVIDDYVGYINDNYDIARLPNDERELIEFVIETMITGIQSDIDRHMYEFKLLVNICKNSYRYFKIVDKVYANIMAIYDESLASDVITLKDYEKMVKDIYDMKIKTMVNDVHRTIKIEDEYLEYTKLVTNFMYDELDTFMLERAYESSLNKTVLKMLAEKLGKELVQEQDQVTKEEPEEKKKKRTSMKDKIVKKIKKVTNTEDEPSKKEKKVKEKEEKAPKKVKGEKENEVAEKKVARRKTTKKDEVANS